MNRQPLRPPLPHHERLLSRSYFYTLLAWSLPLQRKTLFGLLTTPNHLHLRPARQQGISGQGPGSSSKKMTSNFSASIFFLLQRLAAKHPTLQPCLTLPRPSRRFGRTNDGDSNSVAAQSSCGTGLTDLLLFGWINAAPSRISWRMPFPLVPLDSPGRASNIFPKNIYVPLV